MQPLGADEPTSVGPYRLLGRLGAGGMGRVYLGRSAGGRTVAVKIVHPHFALDEEFRARFRREVQAARRVGGAWTAPVLDADPDAPVPWVATAYAAGPTLAAAVSDTGPLPAHTVRALGAGLAEALTAVHELGLVHRDVKPSNVLLTLDGPLLIDFGIARAVDGTASLTSSGVSIGSPGYMSPEQILGRKVTGAADVFSLGAVLAYAATGRPPFPGDSSAALLYKVVHEEPDLGSFSGEPRQVAADCLAKEPSERPAPAQVARRLAPEGAARLVAGGWLPGALVEQVSRDAVRLLNLDTADAMPSGQSGSSGLVGFSRPSVSGTSRTSGTSGAPGGTAAGAGESSAVVGAFGPAPEMPGPRDAIPADRRPGKLSVTVAAGSTPGEGGQGRRMSCTVALAVAGALVAGTLGVAILVPLLGAHDDDRSQANGRDDSPRPTATTGGGGTPGATAEPAALPARYLGTWEGQGTALDGSLPVGTFRITVHAADVGEELGRMMQTDQLGGVCTDVLRLKEVTKTKVVAVSTGAKDNHAGCNPAAHYVELTPTGDDLTYTSDSSAEGKPKARMSKVE